MTVRENPRQSTNADEAQESPVPGDSKVEQGPSMGVRSEGVATKTANDI